MSAEAVRDFLRPAFESWGLPKALRLDNGSPWATQSDIPSALALWAVGLRVRILLNRPPQSTDNAIVERSHGVLARWLEPQRAQSVVALQKQMDWAIRMQRERYPLAQGKTRLELYPNLTRKHRTFQIEQEANLWQLELVLDFIEPRLWQRRVDKVGRISFFSHAYSVGRTYSGKLVTIRLDRQHHQWLIENEQGKILKRHHCLELCHERIHALSLSKRANKLSHTTG